MNNATLLLKAQSPAALAEEYIVKSIWNNHFPAGSVLPSERDLAEKIGVTRTTLREVLQRLARDGWLNIQHGKPTHVNNIWDSAGPNIINTIIKLDPSSTPTIIANAVSLRTRIAEYYIPEAVRIDSAAGLALFVALPTSDDSAEYFAEFDYQLFRKLTFIAKKPVYGLILNSFKALYHKTATLFFSSPKSRQITLEFYQSLKRAFEQGDEKAAEHCMRRSREQSNVIWQQLLKQLPSSFSEVS